VPAQYANDGDISIFAINANTGRLSPIVNNQVQATCISSSGTPSTQQIDVFPTGPVPVWFRVFNGYVWTIDRGTNPSASPSFVSVYSSNSTNGQLLATQNSEFPTGARNLVYIGSGGSYLYLVDQGDPGNVNSPLYTGEIYEYTPGANGSLTAVTNGTFIQAANGFPQAVGPTVLTVDSQNKFLYVANGGPNTAVNAPASSISTYFINSGVISPTSGTDVGTINNTTGSGPRCILEDPSNQYLFTANYNDSTITGKILNGEEGAITPLRRNSTATAPGEPTWCVASGNTF
jgi:6-phosphogluconolactonase (cycloisomerase 2 family)